MFSFFIVLLITIDIKHLANYTVIDLFIGKFISPEDKKCFSERLFLFELCQTVTAENKI